MLLALDIGNSSVVWGVFVDSTLKTHGRLKTDLSKTAGQYGALLQSALGEQGIEPGRITGVVLSSVVPLLTQMFQGVSQSLFGRPPLIASTDLDTGLTLRYAHPKELGSDRLVNAAIAHARSQTDLIIVDFGTATTFTVITAAGEVSGGAIAPGLGISAEALLYRTAQLPKVDLVGPESAIGRDTRSSMQSGLVLGHASLVDGMVFRFRQELGRPARVIATGGLASVVVPYCQSIDEVAPFLTLEGLAYLFHRHSHSRDTTVSQSRIRQKNTRAG
jgi:type III pantothenate kinase